jgi:hypothetical protein
MMTVRLLSCGMGNIHLIVPCHHCYATRGGLMTGIAAKTHKGRLTAKCLDCGATADYFVDAREDRIWKLEPVEAEGYQKVGIRN